MVVSPFRWTTPHSSGKVATVGAKIKVSCSTNQQLSEITPPNQLVSEITPPNQQVAELVPPNPQVSEVTPPNQLVSEITPSNQLVSEVTPPNKQVADHPTGVTQPHTPQISGTEPTQYSILCLPIVHLSLVIQDPVEVYFQWRRPFFYPVRPLQAESVCFQ